MKILFCCEQFPPSTGGVSKVIFELANQLYQQNVEVEIATSFDDERSTGDFPYPVHQFKISGNFVRSIHGEVNSYTDFLKNRSFDLIYVKAAQQWSFDLILENIEKIPSPIAFLPCGLPNLDDPKYETYYQKMREKLPHFAAFFFNSKSAKDYKWISSQKFDNLYVIPNGASEVEFRKPQDGFRKKFNVPAEETLLLSIGNPRVQKGQLHAIQAFDLMKPVHPVTLVLVGKKINGLRVFVEKIYRKFKSLPPDPEHVLYDYAKSKKLNSGSKRVLCIELSREETIAVFFESDLFIFLSYVEYSPLVLFEAMAAGLPFYSTDVGNSKEISEFVHSGFIYGNHALPQNFCQEDIIAISEDISELLGKKAELSNLGHLSRDYWKNHLTWEKISKVYARVFEDIINKNAKYFR